MRRCCSRVIGAAVWWLLLTVVAGREVFRDGRVTTLDEIALRARVRDLARRLAQSR